MKTNDLTNDQYKKALTAAIAILRNDEASTDQELHAHLTAELGLEDDDAKVLISQRNELLRGNQ